MGFLVNVGSNFAQPKIEKYLSRINEKRRFQNQFVSEAFEKEVERLINDPHEELIAREKASTRISNINFSMLMMVLCLMFLKISGLSVDVMLILFFAFLMLGLTKAFEDFPSEINILLKEVDKRKGRPISSIKNIKPTDTIGEKE